MFFLILFGFYHVFLTGRTAAKNNIQFQPYRSKTFKILASPISHTRDMGLALMSYFGLIKIFFPCFRFIM